ncbi:hypothetical protein [Desulfonema magnum]|uniref:Uncharacterized protein n=1 Tax=Desulfonema magnum TaxID=45655 RepID=A0A975BXA8_9BACT|nr:hypothetical protein [Desulfonema magnum]QTA93242.1 Uncharacterized protein dnm_093430 [Desulfonema magnum]
MTNFKTAFIFALAMVVTCAFASSALADDTITQTIEYAGNATALGAKITLQDGCSFVNVVDGDNAPEITPKAGAAGTLDFAWINIPASPFTFSYTVSGDGCSAEISEIIVKE